MTTVTDPKLKQEILDLFNEQNNITDVDISGSKQNIDPTLRDELLQIQKDQEDKKIRKAARDDMLGRG